MFLYSKSGYPLPIPALHHPSLQTPFPSPDIRKKTLPLSVHSYNGVVPPPLRPMIWKRASFPGNRVDVLVSFQENMYSQVTTYYVDIGLEVDSFLPYRKVTTYTTIHMCSANLVVPHELQRGCRLWIFMKIELRSC